MAKGHWKVHLKKDAHKFSSTHLTLFPDGTKEKLHGHNYQVGLTVGLADASFSEMIPFSIFKDALRKICVELDEHILMPAKNKWVSGTEKGKSLELNICGEIYVFPAAEVRFLPVENVTVELLATYIAERLQESLTTFRMITDLEVNIEETAGQSASYCVGVHARE